VPEHTEQGTPQFTDRRGQNANPDQGEDKYDPVTALDMRSGPRDRRQGDRRSGQPERRDYSAIKTRRPLSTRAKLSIVMVCALISAVGVAYLLHGWFEAQIAEYKMALIKQAAATPKPETRKIIVATGRLTYGAEITAGHLRLVDWPAGSVPAGAFFSAKAIMSGQGKRMALATIEANEPLLASKISKPGQVASLAALLTKGKKAVTVRVNDVFGVAGLILPNDRVDVLWTISQRGRTSKQEPFTELLLRDVRVLAIDQRVDKTGNKEKDTPQVAKAVTLEVDLKQAQKIALGASTGTLHLALSGHIKTKSGATSRVSLGQLGANGIDGFNARVIVRRGLNRASYDVLREKEPR
jgi:pilus assembly protein CpaB